MQQQLGLFQRLRQWRAAAAADAAQTQAARCPGATRRQQQLHTVAAQLQQCHVIALLRSQGHGTATITVFYSLLGVAVVASSRLWAGLLDRHRDGQPLARLNALLGCATVLPALTSALPMLVLSGVLFGAVFLSVVASTTALVRHNLPQAQWASGISGFTIVFALGQIVGPTVVGWIADGPGGLARGLVFSAVALWLGALLAWRQKALAPG